MKLIGIDVGNTTTKIGLLEDQRVLSKEIIPTSSLTPEGIISAYKRLTSGDEPAVAVSCVVPEATGLLTSAFGTLNKKILLIGRDIPYPIELDLKDKESVGSDRILAAAIAYDRIGKCLVVGSFGTAITIDCVDDDGRFLGGTILAGIELQLLALRTNTARLRNVSLKGLAPTPWGKDTEEAVSAGIIYGTVGALREIVERFATELGKWPEVILTGGDAELIARHCEFVHAVVPDLVLMGIDLAYNNYYERD